MQENNVKGMRAEGTYTLAQNCIPMKDKGGRIIVESYKQIAERGVEGLTDTRMNIVSIDNKLDAKEYINYFETMSVNVNYSLPMQSYLSGKFVALLDSGFVPYYMPPSFFPPEIRKFFIAAIVKSGVQFYEYAAMAPDGREIYTDARDIWVSKMEAADYLGVSIKDFTTLNFIFEVMRRCAI